MLDPVAIMNLPTVGRSTRETTCRMRSISSLPITLRTWHKWAALILGLQMMIWCVSGLYMVAVDIDFIHGDSLVRAERPAPATGEPLLPIASITARYPDIRGLTLRVMADTRTPVYELATGDGIVLLNAADGGLLSPLPQPRIESLARTYYTGRGTIRAIERLGTVPVEIRGRPAGLWRVEFDDRFATTLYLDAQSGSLVTRRHRYWRIFDAFWMLHVMDYGYERDDVNNTLLRTVAVASLAIAVTGVWLLFYSFRSRRRRA
jgi:uncharacterized iron-regulated membrane protein